MIVPSRPHLAKKDFSHIGEIRRTHQVAGGPWVRALEQTGARAVGCRYGLALSSGTAALHLALLALGVKKGDDVVVPSYGCAALLHAVHHAGARPILADVEPETFNPSRREWRRRVTRRTAAVIATHTFGFPSAAEDLAGIGVPVIEDCSHALGARVAGRPAGARGRVAIFSLYATKMVCAGEGGLLCSNDSALVHRARELSQPDGHSVYRVRFNYKMSDLTAGLGYAQVKKLPAFLARRRSLAERYERALGGRAVLPLAAPGTRPNFYRFVVKTSRAETVMARARARGICCDRPVFKPLHLFLGRAGYPGTELAWKTTVSVPLYPALRESEVRHIEKALPEIFDISSRALSLGKGK